MAHRCGDECPICETVIAAREDSDLYLLDDPAAYHRETGLSVQRADGSWVRGVDWHFPPDLPRDW